VRRWFRMLILDGNAFFLNKQECAHLDGNNDGLLNYRWCLLELCNQVTWFSKVRPLVLLASSHSLLVNTEWTLQYLTMQTNIELKLNSCGRFLGHDVLPDRDSNSTQLLSDKTTHVWTRGTAGINGRYYGMEGKGQTKQISPNKHATIFYPFAERVVNL